MNFDKYLKIPMFLADDKNIGFDDDNSNSFELK